MTNLSDALERLHASLPEDRRGVVSTRFRAHGPFLAERLSRLYGGNGNFETWFAALMGALANIHANRSGELCVLDAEREGMARVGGSWFTRQSMLGYAAYVDRFAGTLAGVADRIPHLRELGVTYLHLLPFLKARAGDNDGGFAVASYDEVDPRFGATHDLDVLTRQLRRAGISLCSDFVLNHIADDHPWAQAARAGDVRYRDFFYVFPDRTVPDRFEKTLVNIFPQAAPGNFTWSPELEGWAWTTFYPYQWDLNYGNPEVFAEMALALLRLANRGVEVFRLDSAAFLWKREGTNGMNQPEAHWILQALRSIVDVFAPGVVLKAEAIVATRDLPHYFGVDDEESRGRECHLAYHSSLMAANWVALALQDASVLREVIKGTPELPAATSWLTYVRCHDDIGWNVLRPELDHLGLDEDVLLRTARFLEGGEPQSFASGVAFQTGSNVAVHGTNGMTASLAGFDNAATARELDDACRRVVLLYSVALCFGGMPLVYMGDEIAAMNDLGAIRHAEEALDTRWVQRPYLDSERFAERRRAGTVENRVFAQLRALIEARRAIPELAAGVPRTLIDMDDKALLALRRGQNFVLVSNFSDREIAIETNRIWGGAARCVDSLSGEALGDRISLVPWGVRWLQRKE